MSEAGCDKRRFVCLTNIPTPYRLHFFHNLSKELEKRGWQIEVWFMAKSEPGRNWRFKPEEFKFPHRFLDGVSFGIASAVFHFNPGIWSLIRKNPPDVLLLAGSWGLPTNIMTTLRTKGLNNLILFWSESHLKSIKHNSWPMNKMRSLLLPMYDGFAVPGRLALDYVQHYAPNRPAYILPNTVNEVVFKQQVFAYRRDKNRLREGFGVPQHRRILFLPARLHPQKGIAPFLSAISSLPASVAQGFSLLIAGDGPLRGYVSRWATQNNTNDVRLLGHASENEMVRLYAAADSFVLPSLSDPNPLSVIEALWAGLPLILSDRVGNHPEALQPGQNGWLFDPESGNAIREVLESWTSASDEQLELQGKVSARIAESKFRTEAVVFSFLDRVLAEVEGQARAAVPRNPLNKFQNVDSRRR